MGLALITLFFFFFFFSRRSKYLQCKNDDGNDLKMITNETTTHICARSDNVAGIFYQRYSGTLQELLLLLLVLS